LLCYTVPSCHITTTNCTGRPINKLITFSDCCLHFGAAYSINGQCYPCPKTSIFNLYNIMHMYMSISVLSYAYVCMYVPIYINKHSIYWLVSWNHYFAIIYHKKVPICMLFKMTICKYLLKALQSQGCRKQFYISQANQSIIHNFQLSIINFNLFLLFTNDYWSGSFLVCRACSPIPANITILYSHPLYIIKWVHACT